MGLKQNVQLKFEWQFGLGNRTQAEVISTKQKTKRMFSDNKLLFTT